MKLTIEITTTNGFEDNAKLRKYDAKRKILEALSDCHKNIIQDNRFDDETILDCELGIIVRSESTISTIVIDDE